MSSRNVRIVCPRPYCAQAISIIYYEGVYVALVIQHAKHMRRIILLYVTYTFLLYFYTSSHKRHDFLKKEITGHKMSVLNLSITFA
jgi:hypothetical protein